MKYGKGEDREGEQATHADPQKKNSQPRGTASRPRGSELLFFKPFHGKPGTKIAVVSRDCEQEPCACQTKADRRRGLHRTSFNSK